MNTDPMAEFVGSLLKNFGGFGALLGMLFFGWRGFMALARDFAINVVAKLEEIKEAIHGNERRVDSLTEKVVQIAADVGAQSARVERLAVQIAGQHQHKDTA
jgi:methyl-accepting chemotaxis protein